LVIETFRRDCPQFEAAQADLSHDDIKPGEHIYMYRQSEVTRVLAEAGLTVAGVGHPDGSANSRLLLQARHAVKAAPRRYTRNAHLRRGPETARDATHTRVSVVIPTYNRADVLRQTLQAYAAQTSPPAEIVVVDDGFTDDTAAVVGALRLPVPATYHR